MLSKNRSFFYLIQDIAGEESSECATRKRKAQSVSAITCWRKLSNKRFVQSFTGPCNTPTHCNTRAIELATDTHFNYFDCDDVLYYPNIVCIQFRAINHLCAQVMKVFSNKFAVFSCFWNLLGHFWPLKYSTSIIRSTLVHYRYNNAFKLLECERISVEIDGFVALKAH